jgi:hypothetical protein
MRPIRNFSLSLLVLLALGVPCSRQALAADKQTNDKHYVIFFASQSEPRRPRLSHTFCTFIKAEAGDPNRAEEPKFTADTISWLPTNGHVRVLKLRAEPGRNFSLDESLRLARATGQIVWSWGPYEVPEETYNKLVRQKARLDSGAYTYKAIDVRQRNGACNCIHAVTNADPQWGGFGVPDQMYGYPSGSYLAETLTARNQALAKNQDWVLDRLGIRTDSGIRFMDYNPERHVHLARTPALPNEPVLSRTPDGKTVR